MEKKDLEVKLFGRTVGAFEDVSNLVEEEDYIEFDSADGHFKCERDGTGYYCKELRFHFNEYKLQVRRTTKAHKLQRMPERHCED